LAAFFHYAAPHGTKLGRNSAATIKLAHYPSRGDHFKFAIKMSISTHCQRSNEIGAMSDGPNERPDPTRDRVDRLLERAFADDPEFRDAFLQVERARRSKIVADALTADDAEALRRIKSALEEIRKRKG